MSGNLIRTAVATVAVAAMTLVGAGMASAAPTAPAASSTVDGYQVEVKGLTFTFNHDQSVALYNAAKAGGAGAVGVLCARYAGPLVGVGCAVLANFIIDSLTDPPAEGKCYQVYPRVGIPPFGARVVNC